MNERLIHDAVDVAEKKLGITPGYSVMHRGRFVLTLKQLFALLRPGPTVRVADVGVWPGYQSLALDLIGYNVTGYDLKPERLPALPFPVLQQDLQESPRLQTEQRSFEAVVATEILEHLQPEHVTDVIAGWRDALVPDGWILLTTPNRHYLGSLLRPRSHGTDTDGHGHTKEYTPAEIRKLFVSGWKNVSVTTVDAYRGVGIVSIKEYYRPLWQWWRHPRKIHNLIKLGFGVAQRLLPPVRDTIIAIAQRADQ